MKKVWMALVALGVLGAAQAWNPTQAASPAPKTASAVATFAGGCFWCMEGPFDKLPGVTATTSGYIGGRTANPTYQEVSGGGTGHAEAVQVRYDPNKLTYQKLLEVYWHNVDPLNAEGQFCDMGHQYRTAIFTHSDAQKKLALASKKALAPKFRQPIATEVVTATTFYPAEDYHQDYYLTNPTKYKYYRWSCGRDKRLQEVWGTAAGH